LKICASRNTFYTALITGLGGIFGRESRAKTKWLTVLPCSEIRPARGRIQKYLRVLVEYADVAEPEISRRMIEPAITCFFILRSNVAPACITDTEVLVSRYYGTH
jgi:hypothetical protein